MQPVRYKRGWAVEAPAGATCAALAAAGRGEDGLIRHAGTAREENGTAALLPIFEQQHDGSWELRMQLPGSCSSSNDIAIDTRREGVMIDFCTGCEEAFLVPWPQSAFLSPEEADLCTARFSRRRGELVVLVPVIALARFVAHSPGTSPRGDVRAAAAAESNGVVETTETSARPLAAGAREARAPVAGDGTAERVFAAEKSNLTMVQIRSAADVHEAKESDGGVETTALMMHSASTLGDTNLLRKLLDARADPDVQDEFGATCLEKACLSQSLEAANLLVLHGASPHGTFGGVSTPLHRAALSCGNPAGRRLVQLLLSHGADKAARDKQGRTPADLARSNNIAVPPELDLRGC
eukprot:TRINITY_DN63387_c0_g1_i1.p1 TRINITY_DN63387_c0_g1~~TRINITY_DN63387_c0_g1_i1.p1  ORF type:complete len:353 (+),score=58.84 TRINITY_DN63387_c0_g1_i1:96-1154(+)